jgi:elongation factor P--beta-lysine ligase
MKNRILLDRGMELPASKEYVQTLKHRIKMLEDELRYERSLNITLEQKISRYLQTSIANINRHTFRTYMNTVKSRDETDDEWNRFMQTFEIEGLVKQDGSPIVYYSLYVSNKVYDWINKN